MGDKRWQQLWYPKLLAADTAYGSADTLGWLVEEEGIEPHIPVFDKSERKDGVFAATDFAYDHKADQYTCPGGKTLKPYWRDIADRRPNGAKDEFHLAAMVQNLRKLAKLVPETA